MSIIAQRQGFQGILFNLLFIVYLWLFQPQMTQKMTLVAKHGGQDAFLGWVLIFASVLETAGLFLKAPRLKQRIAENPHNNRNWILVGWAVWIPHIAITIFILFMIMQSFGMPIDPEVRYPDFVIFIFFVVIVKELFLVYGVYWLDNQVGDGKFLGRESPPDQTVIRWSWLGDLLIFPYSVLAFTAFWELFVSGIPFTWKYIFDGVVEILSASLLFLFAYATSRSIYIIEEWALARTRLNYLILVGTTLLSLAIALWNIPRV